MLLAIRLLTFVLQDGPVHLTQTVCAIGQFFFLSVFLIQVSTSSYFQVSAETLFQTGNEQFVMAFRGAPLKYRKPVTVMYVTEHHLLVYCNLSFGNSKVIH